MKIGPILVRPHAWWNNKIPLSIFLFLLLINGQSLSEAVLSLFGLIIVVCSVANFGYALNDIYDQDEDRRAGKPNAAAVMGTRRTWKIVMASAAFAIVVSCLSAGISGLFLTAIVLLLPLAYSVPPFRIKERYLAGVLADALAAHVFPAMLALLILSHQKLAFPSAALVCVLFIWALATGLRGILTHQFKSATSDRAAGLLTVAHHISNLQLKNMIVFGLTPVEMLAISAAVTIAPVTPFAIVMAFVYLALELLKTFQNEISLRILNHKGHRYVPFINESGYKVWGPLVLALDAAVADPAFLTIALLFSVLYWPQLKQQARHLLISLEKLATDLVRFRERYRMHGLIARSGVITVCDHNYFPGLLMLHRSVQESGAYPVACYDIGLTDAQRAEALGLRNMHILALPNDPLISEIQVALKTDINVQKTGKRVWPLWICPILIKHAPFQKVVWLDCDVVVLRDLPKLFATLDNHPVFTAENFAPEKTPNKPALYERLPIARRFSPNKPVINAGVSGWCKSRDKLLIEAYIYPVARAVSDPETRALISWHDQGALIWAIQYMGKEDCVEAGYQWNKSAANTSLINKPLPWNNAFLSTLRIEHPDVNIMHWNGASPPW
ncbi:UbiA family prenyltransferase [Cypionkella sp.]|uniref:UbiA family prenyltransferase n=1 Tax=Cypionkella sp. TaxID=2811411 RepID=UPI0026064205|nr:UbiA family prenyltransferase [Cypionkella sp.]